MHAEIPLTKGHVAIVDQRDLEDLLQFKWCFTAGYAVRRLNSKKTACHEYMHRRILKANDERVVVHLDDNRLNNRRGNLILAPKSIRQQRMKARGALPFKGVSLVRGRYVAQIHIEGATVHLGRWSNEIDAARAYDLAALRHYGMAARLNFSLSAREISLISKAKS